jgi:heat shock protein HslJ
MRSAFSFLAFTVPLTMAGQSLTEPSKWELVTPSVPKPAKPPVLTFEKGRFGLRVCNSIGGSIKIEPTKLVGGQAVSTLMACVNPDLMSLEKELTEAITKNRTYAVAGNELTITSKSGEQYVFHSVAMPSASAKTRFIYVASETKSCTGVARMDCLQVRESNDQPWQLHYGPIIGFDFVPGTEYRLRIKEEKLSEGQVGPADISRIRWFLDMIVEQKVVDPKAAKP